MKTLTYCGLTVRAGITHQKSNLSAMLREAHWCGRGLVLPEFRLAGHHNYGRERRSTLTEYYDMGSATVDGAKVLVLEPGTVDAGKAVRVHIEQNLTGRPEAMLCKDVGGPGLVRKALEPVYAGFASLRVELETHPVLRQVAERAAHGIPGHSAWVHVRRGDISHRTAEATAPENIRRVVAEAAPETQALYIATDEPDLRFFEPLTAHYDVACLEDFPEFVALALEDNYRLFLVEQVFSRFFPVRISTFRTHGDWFHGALCDTPGWQ